MPIILLTIITASIILGYLISNKKIFLFLTLGLVIFFSIIQFKQTRLTNYFHPTEMETIDQINKMHQYPQYAFRLGHIIEERPESIIFFKLERNFIDTFNLSFFPNYFLTIILLPFFIIGVFKGIDKHTLFTLVLIIFQIILFTFIGHQNSNGPVCLYPIIFAYSFFSVLSKKTKTK